MISVQSGFSSLNACLKTSIVCLQYRNMDLRTQPKSNHHGYLNSLIINGTPTPVVAPSGGNDGWAFQPTDAVRDPKGRYGVGAGADGKIYRIEVTAYRTKTLSKVSPFRRSNKVYLVPFNKLSEEYKRIHRQGGVIASVTPVN